MQYFQYSRIERCVFLAQKSLPEGKTFDSVAELKSLVCREAGLNCQAEGFVVEVKPLSSEPAGAMELAGDTYDLKPGAPHRMRAVYPWSGIFPAGAMSFIGLSEQEAGNIQVGVFFQFEK